MRRPFSVTVLALAVLLLAAWKAWRAVVAVQNYAFMSSLGHGVVWAIGFAIAAYSLWGLRAWGRH